MSSQFKENFDIKLVADENIIIGFSGGKDSVALLHFIKTQNVAKRVVAVHINHNLRETAERDERFCEQFCKKYDIEFTACRINISEDIKKRDGVEKAARDKRYEIFFNIKEKLENKSKERYKIVTAHTLNDNIETFFINLFRSTSIYTLKGIAKDRHDILRPMLNIETETVLEYLNTVDESYIIDESNEEVRFLRNNIRKNLIPILKEFNFEKIVKNISKLQEQSSIVDNIFYDRVNDVIISESIRLVELDKVKYDSLEEPFRRYLLGKIFSKHFKLSDNIIDDAIALIDSENSRRIDMPDGYKFESSFGIITLFHSSYFLNEKVYKVAKVDTVSLLGKVIVFSGELIDKPIIITHRTDGDKVDNKKLKDIFIDNKVRLFDRDRAIVLKDEVGRILFVEGIYPNADVILCNTN